MGCNFVANTIDLQQADKNTSLKLTGEYSADDIDINNSLIHQVAPRDSHYGNGEDVGLEAGINYHQYTFYNDQDAF
jgi:hypothetical protein